ncbi:MAG TPA: DUF2490 domain-containing protein [Kofleriaceae bacterium]
MRLFIICFLVCVPLAARAQRVTDERIWLEGGVDAGVGPRLQLEATQQLRLGIDAGFDETHTQLEANFRVVDFVRIGALYRLIILDNEVRHRIAGQGELRGKVGKLTASYRLRLQETFRSNDDRLVIRNRGKLAVRVSKRVEPFLAIELHHQLDPQAEFREFRFLVGVDWRLSKQLDLATYYMFQDESNVQMPERNHILGVGLTYHFGDLREDRDAGPKD